MIRAFDEFSSDEKRLSAESCEMFLFSTFKTIQHSATSEQEGDLGCPAKRAISTLVAGRLPEEEALKLLSHLSKCRKCRVLTMTLAHKITASARSER